MLAVEQVEALEQQRLGEVERDGDERVGKTSITVTVEVYAERRPEDPKTVKVTEATLTYVAIDRDGRPRPVPR